MLYNYQTGETSGNWDNPGNSYESTRQFWDKHFTPYFTSVLKIEKHQSYGEYAAEGAKIYFTDGSCVIMNNTNLAYDVNCDKGKNSYGTDIYSFSLDKGNFGPYKYIWDINGTIKPPEGEEDFSRDLNDRKNVQRLCKTEPMFCAQLLLMDGWQYKNDYPFRIR